MNAVALQRNSPSSNPDSILLKVTPSGNYATGGDVVSLVPTTWSDPNGLGVFGPYLLPPLPPTVDVANAGGYRAEWIPGTDLTNGKLKWYNLDGTQLAAGAYPAAILASTVIVRVLLHG